MEKPFSADSSPFLTPYTPPNGTLPLKPFTAVDLAPSSAPAAAPTLPRLNAPPQASPFLDKTPEQAFPGPAAAAPVLTPAAFPLAPKPMSVAAVAPPVAPGLIGAEPASFVAPSAAPPSPSPWSAVPDAPAPSLAAAPIVPPAEPPAGPGALRASATPRRGSATEAYPKSALTMTDADANSEGAGISMTTGPNLEGRRIRSYLGIVSVEIVIPKDVLFRNPAPYGDLHRLKAAEEHLQRVKRKAFEELGAKARALGADGVVGATLQFSQFDAMVFLCAALGTAVKIE